MSPSTKPRSTCSFRRARVLKLAGRARWLAAGQAADALLEPTPLAAIALLLLNDHALKARWPGVVTGKLSDAAGLVFFPLLLRVVVVAVAPRVAPARALLGCAVATAVVFAAV